MALDIATITTGIAAIKSGLDIVRGLFDLAKSADDLEQQRQLVVLGQKLVDAEKALVDAERAHNDMRKQLEALEEKLAWKETLEFDPEEQAYRLIANPAPEHGRFCANCWESSEHIVSRMIPKGNTGAVITGLIDYDVWFCRRCNDYSHRKANFPDL